MVRAAKVRHGAGGWCTKEQPAAGIIAIQALYRRVLALEAENAALRRQPPAPAPPANAATAALEERLRRLEALVGGQARR